MCHALLRDANLYDLLLTFDHDLAAEARAAGCGSCGGRLHSARYPRKHRLRETVALLRPTLLVLDPFVRLHRIDELCAAAHNSSHVTSAVM